MNDRIRWNEKYRAGQGPNKPNARLIQYLHHLKRGLALDLASGIGQNAELLNEWRVIRVDISDEALTHGRDARVLADGTAMPFASNRFDTIVCTYYYEPQIDYASLLKTGGTLFFETFTLADAKYRPDFNRAFLLDPSQVAVIFKGLEKILWVETDDGKRVYATFIGRKVRAG